MYSGNGSEKIEINDVQDNSQLIDSLNQKIQTLENKIDETEKAASDNENKFKKALADFQNLEKRTKNDIEQGINKKIDEFVSNFLQIYDDLIRAKDSLPNDEKRKGIESILKNIEKLFTKYEIRPIESLGEIFDPKIHEAIAVITNDQLDDGTITKEIRKGYISQNRVIRAALVEVSKKSE